PASPDVGGAGGNVMSAHLANRTLILGFIAFLGIGTLIAGGGRIAPEPSPGPTAPSTNPKQSSGELDPSFAGDGTTWSLLPGYNGGIFVEDEAEAVAIDATGGILVAIHGEGNGGGSGGRPFNIARYNADGTPDTTFGTNGIASPFGAWWGRVRALAI